MIDFPFIKIHHDVFDSIILFISFAFMYYFCDCANIRNLNIHNTVTPNLSIQKFQLSSLLSVGSKVNDFVFELTPETTFVDV